MPRRRAAGHELCSERQSDGFNGLDDHCTTIVPTIPAWKVQLYVTVPLDCNVVLNMPPGAIDPESKRPGVSDVAVCAMESALVHVIVVPAETVTGLGTYPLVPSERAPTGIVSVTPIGDGDEGDDELPQPAKDAASMTNKIIGNARERVMETLRRRQAGERDHRKPLAVGISGVFLRMEGRESTNVEAVYRR
jgi:hypothetical protein